MSSTQQSVLPLIQPKWKRTIQSTDVQPALQQTNDGNVCLVCHSCESRYTCPRCQTPYCSVACYEQHSADKGSSCTEAFYRDRVSTILDYEAKEQAKSMQQIIRKSHAHDMLLSDEKDHDDDGVSQEDLWRLAEALENGTATDEDADRLLTPEMRRAFERAVKSGELNEMVDPWHPWWLPELASAEELPRPLPELTFNVVDLLYSVALTLRLYHGVDNAVSVSRDACQTLIGASAVLSNDARHASVAEALMACTLASATLSRNATYFPPHWTVLAHDIISLCSSSRHVSHALLEATDVLKAACKELKNDGCVQDADHVRRIRKKVEYYLSWSREAKLPDNLESDILSWIEEWKAMTDNDDELDTLVLPKVNGQPTTEYDNRETLSPSGASLMKEVSSRRKNEVNLELDC